MRIQHDFHIHTTLSSCAKDPEATVENYVQWARKNGLNKIGFSNHMWDSAIPCPIPWYHGQDCAHVAQVRKEFERVDARDVRLYYGCEVEYDYAHRDIALTEEAAQQFDYILVPNSHTHMVMPREFLEPRTRHAQFMFDAFMDIVQSPLAKYVTAIAHPFSAVACPYDRRELFCLISDEQYRECFQAAREAGIAIEINITAYEHFTLREVLEHPAMDMLRIAKACGCKFLFGSDAHTVADTGILGQWARVYMIAELLELGAEDIVEIAR